MCLAVRTQWTTALNLTQLLVVHAEGGSPRVNKMLRYVGLKIAEKQN